MPSAHGLGAARAGSWMEAGARCRSEQPEAAERRTLSERDGGGLPP